MITGSFLTSKDDVSQIFKIRYDVFITEQGFDPEIEVDKYDQMSIYALVYDEAGVPSGTGRLFIDDEDKFTIGRVAVLKTARGKGLGDLIMRMLLYKALEMNAPSIRLGSQLHAIPFYAKFGFKPVGKLFLEEGAPHQMMELLGTDIELNNACNGCK